MKQSYILSAYISYTYPLKSFFERLNLSRRCTLGFDDKTYTVFCKPFYRNYLSNFCMNMLVVTVLYFPRNFAFSETIVGINEIKK